MSRRVLVVGGTGGVGSSIVEAMLEQNYQVEFTYRRNSELVEQLLRAGCARAHQVDLRYPVDLPKHEVDILVNSAGVNLSGHDLFSTSLDEVEATMSVNVYGPLALMKTYMPGMVSRGWGRVININSLWGFSTAPKRLSYALSKHALRALTATAALEVASSGVTVNEICPAAIDTAMLRSMANVAVDEGRFDSVDDYMDDCTAAIPSRRLIDPSSVASAALFLASDGARDVQGQSIRVSGGIDL